MAIVKKYTYIAKTSKTKTLLNTFSPKSSYRRTEAQADTLRELHSHCQEEQGTAAQKENHFTAKTPGE